jgi:hypothetical protein
MLLFHASICKKNMDKFIFEKIITAKNIFFLLTAIILFLTFGRMAKEWAFPNTAWKLEKGEKIGIDSKKSAEQKFSSGENNLARIDMLLGNSDIGDGGTLNLKIMDESCQKEIRQSRIKTSKIDSDKEFKFTFSKIKDSKGKIFCLKISFLSAKGKDAQLFTIDNTLVENISLTVDQKEYLEKSLSMRPAYQKDKWGQNIWRLTEEISQYKPWFLKNIYLLLIAISSIILSIATITILILLSKKKTKK